MVIRLRLEGLPLCRPDAGIPGCSLKDCFRRGRWIAVTLFLKERTMYSSLARPEAEWRGNSTTEGHLT